MELQDIDSVNLPGISSITKIEPIEHYGIKWLTSAFNVFTNTYYQWMGISTYGDKYDFIWFKLSLHELSGTDNLQDDYYFFRIFIDNYTTVNSFKFKFLNHINTFATYGGKTYQKEGVSANIQDKIRIFESPINIEIETTSSLFQFPSIGTLVEGTNLIESIVTSNDSDMLYGDKRTVITFNSAGRNAMQGISTGYKDFCIRINPTISIPMPIYGHCFSIRSLDYLKSTGAIIYNEYEVEYTI